MVHARYGPEAKLVRGEDSRGHIQPLVSLILEDNIQSGAPESLDTIRRILGEALSFAGLFPNSMQ